MRNTPRVMQLWVGEGGEPRDIRNEICLNKVGLGAPRTRIKSAGGDGCGHQGSLKPRRFVHDEHSSARLLLCEMSGRRPLSARTTLRTQQARDKTRQVALLPDFQGALIALIKCTTFLSALQSRMDNRKGIRQLNAFITIKLSLIITISSSYP